MARRASQHPTELELEILKILWNEGPLPVRRVLEGLAPFRQLALTTVTTVLNIMVDKGYLRRTRDSGTYIYHPRITRENTVRGMLGDTVNRLFNGSATAAMLHLLETSEMRPEELKELRRYLDEKAKEGKK